jgi:hypothetical protein
MLAPVNSYVMRNLIMSSGKHILLWVAGATASILVLSLLFGVPYIYSAIGISLLLFGGHLVTIDEDAPGGFANPEGSKEIWSQSLREVLWKLMAVVGLIVLVVLFPDVSKLGAK